MMREIEKLFETLRDEFNQKMSNVSYFTNFNDSIQSHVAYAGGGSITDSYEDISMDEDEIQGNDSPTADRNLKSNKLGSIDSEPESISNTDDATLDSDLLDNQIPEESKNVADYHDIAVLTDIETDEVNLGDIQNKKPNQEIDVVEVYEKTNVEYKSLPIDAIIEDQPIAETVKNKAVNDIVKTRLILEDEEVHEISEVEQLVTRKILHHIALITEFGQINESLEDDEFSDIDIINEIPNNDEAEEIINDHYSEEINISETGDNLIHANAVNINQIVVYESISKVNDCKEIEEIMDNDHEKATCPAADIVESTESTMEIKSIEVKQPEPAKLKRMSTERSTTRKPLRHYSSSRRMWSEMPEVMESGILFSFPKKELQLQEAMFEIITSEESYFKSLMVLTSHFFKSELFTISEDREGLVTQIDKHHIFSNVIFILKASQNLMNDLEQRWHDEKPILSDICDIVLQNAMNDDFQHYVTYLRNQQYQTQALRRLLENESFKQQLSKLESSPKCGKLALDSFLMLPMQRLTRLKLLVEAVSKLHNCEELTDKIKPSTKLVAKNALEQLKKLLNTSNTEKGLMDQKGALLSLINRIDFPRNIKRITFSGRILLREEEFRVHHQTPIKLIRKFSKKKQPLLTLLVFNDLLIITKKKGSRLVVLDYCSKDCVEANSMLYTQEISSNEASSNTSAIDINNEPPSPFRSVGPTLLRSKTSITADEKKRLSVPLNSSFISMPSINKVDEHETKTQTFSLRLLNSHSDIFTSPIFLTVHSKEERDVWLAIFNKDQYQSNPNLSTKSNTSRLQKSLSLKINTNFTEKSQMKTNPSLKKNHDITDEILAQSEIAQDWNDEFLMVRDTTILLFVLCFQEKGCFFFSFIFYISLNRVYLDSFFCQVLHQSPGSPVYMFHRT